MKDSGFKGFTLASSKLCLQCEVRKEQEQAAGAAPPALTVHEMKASNQALKNQMLKDDFLMEKLTETAENPAATACFTMPYIEWSRNASSLQHIASLSCKSCKDS